MPSSSPAPSPSSRAASAPACTAPGAPESRDGQLSKGRNLEDALYRSLFLRVENSFCSFVRDLQDNVLLHRSKLDVSARYDNLVDKSFTAIGPTSEYFLLAFAKCWPTFGDILTKFDSLSR